ncbi:hypothetical protein C2G38_1674245 [Gigaspora rosea]|uniref:Protein kinase domain-containing protein n=1 Tax=Gigaspora rosea TaxID=44941 RepID=A0A397UVF2_9GLOM|nr:hypothetical protein C2G38_1674245 [Gigaspora rosea]
MESDREGKSLSIFSNRDITENEEALKHYLKSANDINSDIKNDIGWCYEYGIRIAKDEKKAYEWYFKAAIENSFCGQNNLGWCFEKGIGVVKDERNAFEWYFESAKGGNSSGQNNLGRCYEIGIGVDKDENKAFKWYLKSASCGNPSGQYNLGICYRNGTGTSPNEGKAIEWLQKSRSNDNKCQNGNEINPNANVDGFLKEVMLKNSLPWIPFNELNNIRKVNTDTIVVYSAEWAYPHKLGVRIRKVKLDPITGSDSQEILLNVLNAYSIIGNKKPTFHQCYGVSRKETTGHYIVVMQDVLANSLECNLYSVARMGWSEKLKLLLYIACDLQLIHSCNLINCGLHKKKILQNNLSSAYIALSSRFLSADKALTAKPKLRVSTFYIAPEVLNGGLFTKASDIYSFGIIMWEISSGKSMTDYFQEYYDYELQFSFAVLNGIRPNISENTVQSYSGLMKRCWDNDPKKRPSASKICKILTSWKNNMAKFYDFESVNYDEPEEDEYKLYEIYYISDADQITNFHQLHHLRAIVFKMKNL